MARLKRNNQYFDLYDFKPSLRLQSNDIGDISKRQSSYSVNFKLPDTAKNRTLLNFVSTPNNNSTSTQKIDSVYLEFGAYTKKGFLRVQDYLPSKYYEVYFLTDLSEWSEDLKDKNLQELNLSHLNHELTNTNIGNSFTNTEGYIYPFINYGWWNEYFSNRVGDVATDQNTYWNQWYPSVYDKTILKQCFQDIGWTLDNDSELLKEPRFQKQVTAFSSGKFENKNTEDTTVMAEFIGNQEVTTYTKLPPTRIVDKFNNFDQAANEYIIPEDGDYVVTNCQLATNIVASNSVEVILFNNAVLVGSIGISSSSFGQTKFDDFKFTASEGDQIEFYLFEQGTSTIYAEVFFYTIKRDAEIQYGSKFKLADTLPSMKQTDFIKDIINMYGVSISTDVEGKTVRFDLYKNIINRKTTAKDWTSKLDVSKEIIINSTTISENYAKINDYKYTFGDNESDVNKNKTPLAAYNYSAPLNLLGDGNFTIDNEYLTNRTTVYTSKFSATIEDSFITSIISSNQTIAYIPYVNADIVESGGNIDSIEVEINNIKTPRKGIVLNNIGVDILTYDEFSGVNIWDKDKVSSGNKTSVPYFYFVKETKGDVKDSGGFSLGDTRDINNYNLSYSTLPEFNNDTGLIDDNYQEQTSIINKSELVECYMKLKEADLLNLNFLQPIKINSTKLNGYYIINKIPNLEDVNKSTKIELINIG